MFSCAHKATTPLIAALLLMVCLFFPPTAQAQPPIAAPGAAPQPALYSLAGRVTDITGNGVPSATVTATTYTGFAFYVFLPALQHGQPPSSSQAGEVAPAPTAPTATPDLPAIGASAPYSTTTGPDGSFHFDNLPAGVYTVAAAKPGFYLQPARLTVALPASAGNANFTALPVPPTLVAPVAAGRAHTCALTQAGGVKCWGANTSGQLGDGTTTGRSTPVDVSGLTSGVQAIAAGDLHTCALMTTGGVKCWGLNSDGQLGDGTTTDRLTPVDVTGLTSGVQAIAAGDQHTCALTAAGGVKCWGDNAGGLLGDGTTNDSLTPVDVSGLTSGVLAIAAGNYHTCALTAAGGVKCWGSNWSGQLGDGTTHTRLTPVDGWGLTSGMQAIAAGNDHTCALTHAGGVKCWGNNLFGGLGDGTTNTRVTPVDVRGLAGGVQAIAAGEKNTCALTTAGGVKCWGYNAYGRLGDGTPTDRLAPVDVSGLTAGVQAIAVGGGHTCALLAAGGIKCWGDNYFGQLGNGARIDHWTAVVAGGLTGPAQAIAAGANHTCALTTAAGLQCWGFNWSGQLGDGTTNTRFTPAGVTSLTNGIQAIAAGDAHTCALTTAGGVLCWGNNINGQLGDGTTTDRLTPVDVSGLTNGIQAIAAGANHTCALTTAGGVLCWGNNSTGQLGDGTTTDRLALVDVSGLTSGVQAIVAGANRTCALTTTGGVLCWGNNSNGQLGVNPGWLPVDVALGN